MSKDNVIFPGVVRNVVSRNFKIEEFISADLYDEEGKNKTTGFGTKLEILLECEDEKFKTTLNFSGNTPIQSGDFIKAYVSREEIEGLDPVLNISYLEKYVNGKLVRTDFSTDYKIN